MDKDLFEDFLDKRILFWHSNFSFSLKAEMLEEMLVRIFEEDMNLKVLWNKASHSPGMDIAIIDGDSYSVKSGKEAAGKIKISSSRTTTYKTIEEKINFYKGVEETFSHYFFLSKRESNTELVYMPYIVPRDVITIDSISFGDNSSGWTGKTEGYSFDIKRSMSDQIWISVDKDYIKDYALRSIGFDVIKRDNGLDTFNKKS